MCLGSSRNVGESSVRFDDDMDVYIYIIYIYVTDVMLLTSEPMPRGVSAGRVLASSRFARWVAFRHSSLNNGFA